MAAMIAVTAVVEAAASFIAVEFMVATVGMEATAFAAMGKRTAVTVTRIEAIVHPSMEIPGAMEPWTGTDKNPVWKPCRAVIAIGGTIVGS